MLQRLARLLFFFFILYLSHIFATAIEAFDFGR